MMERETEKKAHREDLALPRAAFARLQPTTPPI